jgi:hypothetical protein
MLIGNSNLVVDKIVLNKSKNKSIVFIHGFYANAGYWLPYLPFFKDYKIILLNLDYFLLLDSNNKISKVTETLESLNLENNIHSIIGHSLGTIISNFFNYSSIKYHFDICPVSYASRIDTNGFINDILSRINESEENIKRNLNLVDLFIIESKDFMVKKSKHFIPDADQFFNYKSTANAKFIFKGDHFNITNAISHIVKFL